MLRSHLVTDDLRSGAHADVQLAEACSPGVEDAAFRARMLGLVAIFRLNVGLDALPQAEEALAASLEAGRRRRGGGARTTYGTVLVAVGRDEEGLEELVRAGTQPRDPAPDPAAQPAQPLRRAPPDGPLRTTPWRWRSTGLRAAETFGMERSFGTYLEGNAAESMLATGEWSAAADLIADAVMLDPPSSHRTHVDLLLAWLHLWRDELELADAVLREHRVLALSGADQPMPQFVAQLIRIDGEFAVLTGEPERAWSHFAAFLGAPVARRPAAHAGRWSPWARRPQRRWTPRSPEGRSDLVREVMSELGPTTMSPVWLGLAEAELADTREAWEALLGVLRAASCPVHLVPYAQLRLAGHLSEARDRTGLKALLDEAMPASRRARCPAGHEPALRPRPAGGGRAGPGRRRPPRRWSALTARELEVLRLVGAGRSNKEIGDGALHQRQDRERARLQHPGRSSGCPDAARPRRWPIATVWRSRRRRRSRSPSPCQ